MATGERWGFVRSSSRGGQTGLQEWLAGADPRDPLSFFRLEAVDAGPPVSLFYQGLTGRVYSLYAASEPAAGSGEPK